jgi:hypothetical protein
MVEVFGTGKADFKDGIIELDFVFLKSKKNLKNMILNLIKFIHFLISLLIGGFAE